MENHNLSSETNHFKNIFKREIEKPILATISKIEHSSAIIMFADFNFGILPLNEIWTKYKLHDKPDNYRIVEDITDGVKHIRAIQNEINQPETYRTLQENDQILVVPFDKAFNESGQSSQYIYSHIRAYFNPWKEVSKWKNYEVKSFIVEVVTNEWALGTIEPGIRARVSIMDLQEILPEEKWHGFQKPLPRDEIAGLFVKDKIDKENQIVTLDFLSFIKADSVHSDLFVAQEAQNNISLLHEYDNGLETHESLILKNSSLRTMFLLDDDEMFLRSMATYLIETFGIKVLACSNDKSALETLEKYGSEVDLAILDVNLNTDTTLRKDHKGMSVAYYLQSCFPNCPIVLTTGEEIDPLHPEIQKMPSLMIQGIVYKPFGLDSLHRSLNIAEHPPVPLSDFFVKQPIEENNLVEHNNSVQLSLRYLQKNTFAEAAVLFQLNPITDQVKIIAIEGPIEKYHDKKNKLAWSPVRDSAVNHEVIFTEDAGGLFGYPKHRHLYNAYNYSSCIGVPVHIGSSSYFAYSLFIFHPKVKFFAKNHASDLVRRAAIEIEYYLKAKKYEDEIRQMKPFEMMGQAYGSLAHDLSKDLSSDFLLTEIENLLDSGQIDEAKLTLKETKARIQNAQQIVRSFRDMARGQTHEIEIFEVIPEIEKIIVEIKKEIKTPIELSSNTNNKLRIEMRKTNLKQLFYNLLLNAAQQINRLPNTFKRKGQIHVQLIYELDEIGMDWLNILIHDNGPGIHYCNFKQVFDLHYTTKEDGCGMGLDICKKIAEGVVYGTFKGSIKVKRSILLSGTSFKVRLPLLNMEE